MEKTLIRRKKKHIALWIALGILAVALLVAVIFVIRILTKPESFFETSEVVFATEIPAQTALAPAFPIPTKETDKNADQTSDNSELVVASVEPVEMTATPESPATPKPVLETSGVLNILLLGLDAYENGGTTSGTMPHTDANMVIAINFDKNTVDLISIPRDIITTAPGYYGFYKFNCVFNVGGGMDDISKGLEETCKAAEVWLGGAPVPYYYAVDFQAVIDIVDAIGGIDYDVDQQFYSFNSTKLISKGKHHLDGEAVLGYLRMRKQADGLDSSRTARQRKMMVAIFNKLKTEGKLSMIPGLINAVSSGIYTNTTLAQTTALANYAMNLNTDSIRTRAFSGTIHMRHTWAFCFIDQQNRIDIIKEVYGIDASPMGVDTVEFEDWLYETGFDAIKHIRQAEKVLAFIQEQKNQGITFSEEQIKLYIDCYTAYYDLNEAYNDAVESLQRLYTNGSSKDNVSEMEKKIRVQIEELKGNVKNTTEILAKECSYTGKLKWSVYKNAWDNDLDINEIYVNFR